MTIISIDQKPTFEIRTSDQSPAPAGTPDSAKTIPGLTPRQKQAIDFIHTEIVTKGISPSFDEIGAELGLVSKGAVARLVDVLVDRGFITIRKHVSRSIALIDQSRPDAARLDDAVRQIERLREALIEMRTATGEGLSPEETGHIHMRAGIGRATEATPGYAEPSPDRSLPKT
jgi:DNA-binding MarR family transcriptional regulator